MDVCIDFSEIFNAVNTINKNGQQLGEIRQNLTAVTTAHLAYLKASDWETEVVKKFDAVFKDGEGDIKALEQVMQEFVSYLDHKIQQLKKLEDFNFLTYYINIKKSKIMADVWVELPELKNFKEIVVKNKEQFGEIREKLTTHLTGLRSGEWETKGARSFDETFKSSEQDMKNLEEIMQEFIGYLNGKIAKMEMLESHSF
jgi:uncharacterized protein YukE